MTASFIKELLRRAALNAAESAPGANGPLSVTNEQVQTALNDLLASRNVLTRALLGVGNSGRPHRHVEWVTAGLMEEEEDEEDGDEDEVDDAE